MSVNVEYFLVDWNEFVSRYRDAGSADKYYQKYFDLEQWWLVPFEPTIWHRSHISSPQTDIFYFHEAIQEHLEPRMRSQLETLIQSVALIDGKSANDLGDEEYFAVSMSPATVREILQDILLLDFEDLRPCYDKYFHDDTNRRLTTFDEIKEFLQGFVDIMLEAQRTAKGVVISIA